MNTYERLGLRRVINAYGTVTILGGSMMPPEVVEAMREAAGWFIDLPELHRVAGKRIAELIGSPAIDDAAVVCGAAAGLAVATAACVAGTDGSKIRALPHLDWEGAKDQVVIQKSHKTGFAQNYRNAGPRLVEIGDGDGATPDEFEAAMSERTAAVTFLGGELAGNARFATRTSLTELVTLAHARGVPVIVDAAAELPPAEHLSLFSELGADLVIFSGGKGLRGPQASGMIVGKGELVEACRLNNNPHSSVGRPMKVGKEEICGLLKAIELYVARDHAADLRDWDGWTQTVLDGVRELEGITGERFLSRGIPHAKLNVNADRAGKNASELALELRKSDPSIRLAHDDGSLTVNPHNLQPGEAVEIVERLGDLLVR